MDEALADSGLIEDQQQGPQTPSEGQPTNDADVQALLDEALQHFEAADRALQRGDLGTYQREIDAAQELVRQAGEASLPSDTPQE